jgi:cytochrome c peroxidase
MKRLRLPGFLLVIIGMFLMYGCGNVEMPAPEDKPVTQQNLDVQLDAIIAEQGLTGDSSVGRDLPDIEDPLAQLGKKLFFTKALSGKQDSACVTCHHPALGGGDALPMSIGVGAYEPDLLGPGRIHPQGPLVPRNAPTTFNVAMWDQFLFHDGRIESMGKTPGKSGNDGFGIRTPDQPFGYPDPDSGDTLAAAQARFPVTAEDEMRGFDFGTDNGNTPKTRDETTRERLAAIIGDCGTGQGTLSTNNWLSEFQTTFNSDECAETLITFENIIKAIEAYENSQVFVDTPWRAYVQGDDQAISDSAKRGAILFYTPVAQQGADCYACHSGDFFTDEQFYALAIPQIGRGKASGPYGDDDFGRYLETGDPDDKYAFRVPTLLNVEVTGPYGHDGAYDTLEGIVRHHLNPAQAIENYDFSALDPSIRTHNAEEYTQNALAQLQQNREKGILTVQDIELSDEQVNDLLSFLLTLTDPCVKDRDCLSPWIPDENDSDPDGMRLVAVDENGKPF